MRNARRREEERKRGNVDPRTAAFLEEMWRRENLPELYGYLRQRQVFDRQKSDEILGAARLRVLNGYQPHSDAAIDDFKRYFRRTIESEIIDRSRRFVAKFIRCDEEVLKALSARSASSASPEDRMLEREKRASKEDLIARLHKALPLLRPGQQTILEFRYLHEGDHKHTFEEIGAELGISADAARMRCDRALKRLAALLLGAR